MGTFAGQFRHSVFFLIKHAVVFCSACEVISVVYLHLWPYMEVFGLFWDSYGLLSYSLVY